MSDLTQSHCSECHGERRHHVVGHYQRGSDDGGYWWTETVTFLRCSGCDAPSIRKTFTDAAMREESDVTILPPASPRSKPSWIHQLPHDAQAVMEEIYKALAASCAALSVMGARTLVDLAIRKKVEDHGDFAAGLRALTREGYVSARDAEVLTAAVDAGSAAAHRGFQPKPVDLEAVIDIVEHVLESVFVLGDVAERLRAAVPPRPPRKKPETASRAVAEGVPQNPQGEK